MIEDEICFSKKGGEKSMSEAIFGKLATGGG